jgi:hypothetical protein
MTNYEKWVVVEQEILDYYSIRNNPVTNMQTRVMAGAAIEELKRKSKDLRKLWARGSRK